MVALESENVPEDDSDFAQSGSGSAAGVEGVVVPVGDAGAAMSASPVWCMDVVA